MKKKLFWGIFTCLLLALFAFRSLAPRFVVKRGMDTLPTAGMYIVVDKSDYELHVYDEQGWYATYPVVFGSKSLDDKMMEGDRKTPEGSFRIISKKPHKKWHKILMLDYPNKESWEKFNTRKARGVIPKSAKIGGGIALHGTWPNDNMVIDEYKNWTLGCISMRNSDLDDLWEYVPEGTKFIIRK